jgi:hypothetical protein
MLERDNVVAGTRPHVTDTLAVNDFRKCMKRNLQDMAWTEMNSFHLIILDIGYHRIPLDRELDV